MPFMDNDPSKDWIQPDFARREKKESAEDFAARLDRIKFLEKNEIEKGTLPMMKKERAPEPALRYDGDKSRVDLIPPEFILALGEHFGHGAKKYSERNWEKGMSWSRCYASAQRHMLAFWQGEELDPETGTPHVIAVAWNMCALHWYGLYRRSLDDRPKAPSLVP